MKKVVSLIMCIMLISSVTALSVSAVEAPTAKVIAQLVGDTIPEAGDRFEVKISATEITSGLFVSGQVGIEYPVDVVTPLMYWEEENYAAEYGGDMIGNITNEYMRDPSIRKFVGKFTFIEEIDLETGKGIAGVYINIGASDQTAEAVTNGTFDMFNLVFLLNEGYTYDDFYLTINPSQTELFLTADKNTLSHGNEGKVTVQSIEKADNATATSMNLQNGLKAETLSMNSLNLVETAVTGGVSADISILYDDEYYESVLVADKNLSVNAKVTNSGTSDKTLVCYVAEYGADGSLVQLTSNGAVTALAGETTSVTVSKTLTNESTVSAKVFLWEKDKLVPIGNEVELTGTATDYYGETYADAKAVENNTPVCGAINVEGDVDVVKFISPATGLYVFKSGRVFGLYDSTQSLVNAVLVDGEYAFYSLSANAEYYIMVSGGSGSYRIDPKAPNSVTLNDGIAGIVENASQYDLYKFTALESRKYIVTAVGSFGVKATLYNADFEKIASSETGDSNVSFRITYDMTENSEYYIIIEQKTGQTEEAEYSLYVEEPFAVITVE